MYGGSYVTCMNIFVVIIRFILQDIVPFYVSNTTH